MTTRAQIWIGAAHHPAFRCGGWASLCEAGDQVSGAAGGERNTTAGRMALAGLVSALRGLSIEPEKPIRVLMTGPELTLLPEILAGRAQPEEDLDLWAQIAKVAETRRLELVRAALDPATPTAFVAAWANLAMDKAKATGPFAAAIPKSNLTKAPGLSVGQSTVSRRS
jgi:hypothetical protein